LDEYERLVELTLGLAAQWRSQQARNRRNRRRFVLVAVAPAAGIVGALAGIAWLVRASERGHRERALAEKAAQCRATDSCRDSGWCGALSYWGEEPFCAAVDDGDCARSTHCKQSGECSAARGRCEATRDSDCLASKACIEEGRCAAQDGRCIDPAHE